MTSFSDSIGFLDRLDRAVAGWMARHGVGLLRISLGIIFVWFGILKFFPGSSPAEKLAGQTIEWMSFGVVKPSLSLPVLAAWECAIGAGLLTRWLLRATIFLLFLQMAGTLMPLLAFPHETFLHFPYAPTLEGQYIIKNIVLISAGIVVGATVRQGKLAPIANSLHGGSRFL